MASPTITHGGDPKVSIVIPTYNRATFLGECVDSALSQDYPNYEVIVVDDGSDDDTPEVCRKYGTSIKYIRKENGGAASALNVGLGAMKGAWFKWLSSDDLLEPKALSTLVAAAKSRAGVVYGDYLEIGTHGGTIRKRSERVFHTQEDFMVELWRHFVGSAVGALIRKDCIDRVGHFNENLRYAEDYDWWLRAALIYKVQFQHIPATVARYRVHPGQTMSERKERAVRGRQQIRANLSMKLALLEKEDPLLYRHYVKLTLRYRKICAPLLPFGKRLGRLPKGGALAYWAGLLGPRWANVYFWAANPPIRLSPSQH